MEEAKCEATGVHALQTFPKINKAVDQSGFQTNTEGKRVTDGDYVDFPICERRLVFSISQLVITWTFRHLGCIETIDEIIKSAVRISRLSHWRLSLLEAVIARNAGVSMKTATTTEGRAPHLCTT